MNASHVLYYKQNKPIISLQLPSIDSPTLIYSMMFNHIIPNQVRWWLELKRTRKEVFMIYLKALSKQVPERTNEKS